MKKRLIINCLIAMMLVTMLAPAAFALDTHIADGTCGEGLTWSLDGYTLTISGDGEMEDGAPWEEYKDHIETVILDGDITRIGAKAFCEYDRLETVDFGDALVNIGEKAFYGCTDIEYLHLPDTFRKFEAQSFRGCTSLKFVYCDGPMPSFRDSCLWTGNYIAVFYPTNNPWPGEAVQTLISNYGGRLGIMMGNFDASSVAEALTEYDEDEEETEEETTEATEETVEETTAAATEPVVAVVETEPETVPTTVPETEPTETTVPETEETTVPTTEEVETTEWDLFEDEEVEEEETVVEKVGGNGWIGMVLIAGVLTFLIVGALIFRSVSHRNRRY